MVKHSLEIVDNLWDPETDCNREGFCQYLVILPKYLHDCVLKCGQQLISCIVKLKKATLTQLCHLVKTMYEEIIPKTDSFV